MENWIQEKVDATDMETKIALTAWVMKHIVDHARDGGSFRYLIYTRLGLDMSAYVPLCSDGITISNEFDLNLKDDLVAALKGKDYRKMKDILGLCDQLDCWNSASVWTPQIDGVSALCHLHSGKDLCGNKDT